MRKKGNTVLAGLIICLLLVFLAAAGKLFGAYLKYQKGDVSYEKLQEYVQKPEEEESPEPEKEKEEPQSRYLEIDFAGLKAVNPDVIAWIQILALDISYPVVQGKDNAYYLHHLFSGESNINGSIFVDCHNQPDFTDQNTIVYGHNMKNGSMFGTLDKYQDQMGMKQKQRRKTIRFETQMLSDIALFATVMMGIVYVLSYEWRCASKDAGSLDVTFWMYWILIVGIYLLADRLVQWLFAQYVIKRVEKGND